MQQRRPTGRAGGRHISIAVGISLRAQSTRFVYPVLAAGPQEELGSQPEAICCQPDKAQEGPFNSPLFTLQTMPNTWGLLVIQGLRVCSLVGNVALQVSAADPKTRRGSECGSS